ncbi:MAG: DegT/DnrJ/EryC1/StrS family aminotransferase [Dehalococcoidia bacterium]|nr:DegT/DnrJ/EryC1/StrS family aminotransferase [Dehalococcoidia bacterium]
MIPLFRIDTSSNVVNAVTHVIQRGAKWAGGREVEEFEQRLCRYVGCRHAVVVNSGTSALHMALMVHDIGPRDEVIVPSFTFIATANCALFVGAKPVFADIDETTLGLDPEDVEARIISRTRAIVCTHYGGNSCAAAALRALADRHGLILIEDAAESLGATHQGRNVGTFGHAAVLSFCQNKLIATGEGGALLTDSDVTANRARLLRSHGRNDDGNYFSASGSGEYIALGYNFRMSNILAAVGIAQMNRIDELVAQRIAAVAHYNNLLSAIQGIALPEVQEPARHVYQMYTVRITGGRQVRDKLQLWLREHGVASKVYFEPVHTSPFYRDTLGYAGVSLPISEQMSGQVLTLPLYPEITFDQVEEVCSVITEFFERRSRDG